MPPLDGPGGGRAGLPGGGRAGLPGGGRAGLPGGGLPGPGAGLEELGPGDLALADVAALEQQLADLAVTDGDAAEVLTRLAEAVFPGGAALGDPARLLWPERPRAAASSLPPAPAESLDPRKRLEAQIRQSEARFRSLVEQLPAVVFYAALGDEENEVYVSPHIESLLGFTQEEWLTNPLLWYSQLHPDDHATVIEAFTRGVQTGSPFRAQVRFFSRDGEEVWILGEARLIRDELGRPAYFQGVAFDITMTKRAQEVIAQVERAKAESAQLRAEAFASHNIRLRQLNRELRAARDEAEAAAQARSTFLTTMSHELRTPLNSIIVLAGLLADESLTLAQHDMVRRLRLSSDHLLALINDVLEFSRLRAGQVELAGRPFDLLGWLDDTLDIVAPRAAEKGLELRLTVARPVPARMVSDEGRLRQVLLNLLGNAVKFTATGFVEVRVDGHRLDDGRWEIECAVVDTGMGIRAEDALTLFDEFRQADTGISREFGGTGLGLAICKHLCGLLGGRIWVEASGGPGTTVAFTWVAPVDGDGRIPAGTKANPPAFGVAGAADLVGAGAGGAGAAGPLGPGAAGPLEPRAAGPIEPGAAGQLEPGAAGQLEPGAAGPIEPGGADLVEAGAAGPIGRGQSGPAGPVGAGPADLVGPGGADPLKPGAAGLRAAGLPADGAAAGARPAPVPPLGGRQVGAGAAGPGPGRGGTPVPAFSGRLRILLAEDNAMNQQVALLLLGAMGHDADLVANGEEAIAAVRARPYDVVLMDIAMPGTDGLSATRAIRTLGETVHQPHIVALTAHAFPGDAEVCFEAGMDDYVTKPIDRGRLAEALAVGAAKLGAAKLGAGKGLAGPPPPARTPPASMPKADPDFDPALARSIQDEFGRDALRNLVGIFRAEASRLLGAASMAVTAGDIKAVETAVHTLKSGAANLGARGLYDNCNRLEAMARGHSLDGAEALTASMARQLAFALHALDRLVSG